MKKFVSLIALITLGLILMACTPTKYTVTFNTNGGSDIVAIQVEKGQKMTAPTPPNKPGFAFDGWYKESALTTPWVFETDIVLADTTLYAKWSVTDQAFVDQVHDWLNLGNLSALTNQSPRIIFPTNRDGVTIAWAIDKPTYIQANGLITQPTFEVGTQTVTLTATLTKGSVTRTKIFTATVLALPSIEETPALLAEDFKSYADGNILTQSGIWAPVSGKAGSSLFSVVSSTTPAIPNGSKALKVEAFTELQIEAGITHSYDVLVFEVDLMQTASSNSSAINIQSASSSPVIGFGLDGASLFYRTDNGTLIKRDIQINQWYTLRVEVDLVNKTIEAFYYEAGQLVSLTPGKVSYTGSTTFQSIYVRSGSSNTTALRTPAYMSNLIVNRIEALPRPVEVNKLGAITDIRQTVSIETGTTFTLDIPKVYNYFGAQQLLVKDTDYTLVIQNPVNTEVAGDYTVTYTFTNSQNSSDVKVVTQAVNVYSPAQPNEITSVISSQASYLDKISDITITVVQPSGALYYLLSNNETETKTAIMAGITTGITAQTIVLEDLEVDTFKYIHVYVELNGDSNIISHQISREAVIEITDVAQFVSVFSTTAGDIINSYALMADLDLSGVNWADGNTSFKGRFYGNGHTISNLLMVKTGTNYGGLFARINGGHVRDLVLDNIHITAIDRAGILAGRIENTASSIQNVVIMNSYVQGANANGVGGVIGHVAKDTLLSNVTIIDTEVYAPGFKNVGGVVGRVDSAPLNASDIYVRGVIVRTNVAEGLDVSAGAFIGYVRDNSASVVNANRIVIIDTEVNAVVGGALIGYLRAPGSAVIQNAYLEVNFTHPTAISTGLIGRVNNEADKLNTSTIFGVLTGTVDHAQTQVFVNTSKPNDGLWWSMNLTDFTIHPLWALDSNHIYALKNYIEFSAPIFTITLEFNVSGEAPQTVEFRQGASFDMVPPSIPGYTFTGWYLDALMTQPIAEGYNIVEAVTLYGMYEPVPASTVSFNTSVEGLTVDAQLVNYGELASLPVVENQMIGGVMKRVSGWTLNGNPISFSTPITGDITLEAVWSTVELTVTFNGENPVTVLWGETVSAPDTNPVHIFVERPFVEWRLAGVTYDFNAPVTANINLVPLFGNPTGAIEISTLEQFHIMATVESTYSYKLMNDLDFTGFTWGYANTSFKGQFDGQGFTIANLTMTGLTNYGGIFPRANNATIENLVIDNVHISTTARAGILVGRIENGDVMIQNIVIKNSSVYGNDTNGVGGLVGHISRASQLFNIAIIDTDVTNNAVNVGGFVGRVDTGAMVIADDIFLSGVTVKSNSANTADVAASALVGYIANTANTVFSAIRVVVLDTIVDGNVTAAFVGYNRHPGTANIQDAYFEVTYINNERSGFIGYNRDQVVVIDQTSIFGNVTNDTPHSNAVAFVNSANPTDAAWWTTNLNNIATSDLWVVNADGSVILALVVPQEIV